MYKTRETVKDKNPYKRGADDGLIMGVLLIAMFLASVYAVESSFIAVIAAILIIFAVPAATYIMLRRSNERDCGCTLFSSLWVQGITIFFCGTLLLSMFQYIYFRFIAPTYIVDVLNAAAEIYSGMQTPEAQDMADLLRKIVSTHNVPSAIDLAVMTLWAGVFTGSLLSAAISGIVKITNSKSKKLL